MTSKNAFMDFTKKAKDEMEKIEDTDCEEEEKPKKDWVQISLRVTPETHRAMKWHQFMTNENMSKLINRLLADEIASWNVGK